MKLSAEGKLRIAARLAFVMGVAAGVTDALAQEVAQAASPGNSAAEDPSIPATGTPESNNTTGNGQAKQLGGVQVTGSRIKSVNVTGDSPVTVINSAELKFEGTTRVEDLINNLPQAFADQGSNISNGSDGSATVNLRNLGSSRTLVLIDGKRLQPGSVGSPQADLNFIPAQLIDRVEVLTGGASAIYGSDAVAGVVNFILKKDFQGFRVDYQRSGYLHDNNNSAIQGRVAARNFGLPNSQTFDGQGNELTLLFGVNTGDGKGNATVYGTYLQQDAISQSKRDFSACSLSASADPSGFTCAGSGTPASTRISLDGGATSFNVDPATGNTFRRYVGSRDAFNFAPYNYYQRNNERYTLGGSAHYEFSSHADAYTEVAFSDYRTNAVIAPSGAFFGNRAVLSCDNPFLSTQEQQQLCGSNAGTSFVLDSNNNPNFILGRRNVEGGGRDAFFDRSAYRVVFGLKGDITPDISYDTSIQYGSTRIENIYRNDFSTNRLNRALNVTTVTAATAAQTGLPVGAPVCRSVLDGSDLSCVPYNIFQAGGVTPQALAYLQVPGLSIANNVEQVATGSVTANLGNYGVKSPFAADGISVAGGGEYRRETSRRDVDNEFATGDLAGQGGATPTINGAFAVKELFAETKIPLLQHLPFAEIVSFDAAYRYSQYNSTGSTNTYKFGGEWGPTKDIRFRGGYNRAVRAPSIGELVQPVNVQLDGASDPCAGPLNAQGQVTNSIDGSTTGKATRTQCLNDPLIARNPNLYGNIADNTANQYNGQTGTSPGLQPEKSDTYTGGFVFTPTFVKNLTLTVDYYTITVNGFIGVIGADNILNTCYANGALCNLINRAPGTGSLFLGQSGFVIDTTQNTGSLTTKGIDISLDYRLKLAELGLGSAAGTAGLSFVGTRDLKQTVQPIPGDPASTYECAGKYGTQCGIPAPIWRHKLRGTYSVATPFLDSVFTFSPQWRYFSSVQADANTSTRAQDAKLSSRSYIDLSASLAFKSAYTFRVGVNNVFDKDPPLVGSAALTPVLGNGNTYPQVYDALGRFLFASVTLDF